MRHELERFLQLIPNRIVAPSSTEVLAASQFAEMKDTPIVPAAKAGVDHLATPDRRHLLEPPEVMVLLQRRDGYRSG